MTLGGDHSIGLGTVAGAITARPDAGIIWVDAHADINTPEVRCGVVDAAQRWKVRLLGCATAPAAQHAAALLPLPADVAQRQHARYAPELCLWHCRLQDRPRHGLAQGCAQAEPYTAGTG